jgi:hypothetical protein
MLRSPPAVSDVVLPDQPIVALVVSYVLPILLLPVALYLIRLRAQ